MSDTPLPEIPAARTALEAAVAQGLLSGAVTLAWRRGELIHFNAVGLRDVEAELPMRRDTLFRIASMTKPMTSVAALQFLEEGRFALEDPITSVAPEFARCRVLLDPTGPLDATRPASRAITFEDLLTHRSGLAYDFTSEGPIAAAYREALGSPLDPRLTPDAWIARLAELPLAYDPGERFHYGVSTDLLGFLLGRMAGKPFREVLRERLIEPLGMADTDFWIAPDKRDRAAKVYELKEERGLVELRFRAHEAPPAFTSGGGGLISTADDYLAFARMLLNGGELDGRRYLKAETVAEMTSNRLTPAQREIPFMGLPFWAGQGFGLGVSVVTDAAVQAWLGPASDGAYGWPGAFGTWWRADPAKDLVILYLVQNAMPLEPGSAGQLATGQRLAAAAALPQFLFTVYGAL